MIISKEEEEKKQQEDTLARSMVIRSSRYFPTNMSLLESAILTLVS
jgi:hypothetical protein